MKIRPNHNHIALSLISLLLSSGTLAFADEPKDLGQIIGDLRLRFEHVDQDNKETADAGTSRIRIGYTTPKLLNHVSAMVEGEANGGVGSYNSTKNGDTKYATVSDPNDVGLNQAWLKIDDLFQTSVKVGRQEIILDDHRYIGNVGWRNLEQTFDAVIVKNTSVKDVDVTVGFITNQIDVKSESNGMSSPIVRVQYDAFGDKGKITLYGYFIDYDDAANYGKSNQTIGGEFEGAYPLSANSSVLYKAGFANQKDFGTNPTDYEANRYLAELGIQISKWTGRLGYEVLGADREKGVAFITPLATLHKFQGWADQFLKTPAKGIEDKYAELDAKEILWGVTANASYHNFDSAVGGVDYGDEIDLSLSKTMKKRGPLKGVQFVVKAAIFDASKNSGMNDTTKVMLQVSTPFKLIIPRLNGK